MPMTCIVLSCRSRAVRDQVAFYSVPSISNHRFLTNKNELSIKRRALWIAAIKRDDLTESKLRYQRVCSKHFIRGKPAPLLDENHPDWVPSQNMGHVSQKALKRPNDVERKERRGKRSKLQVSEMTGGKGCSVAICKSNSQKAKKMGESICFFSFPKDPAIRNEWIRKCYRKDKFSVANKRICSKHFKPEDFEDKLKAELLGTQRKKLIKSAIPSLLLLPPATIAETSKSFEHSKCAELKQRKIFIQSRIEAEKFEEPLQENIEDEQFDVDVPSNSHHEDIVGLEHRLKTLQEAKEVMKNKIQQKEEYYELLKNKLIVLQNTFKESESSIPEEAKEMLDSFLTSEVK